MKNQDYNNEDDYEFQNKNSLPSGSKELLGFFEGRERHIVPRR